MILEDLYHQWSIVALPDEPFVKLELDSLKVDVKLVGLVDQIVQVLEKGSFGRHDELLGLEKLEVVLG